MKFKTHLNIHIMQIHENVIFEEKVLLDNL